MIAVGLLLVVVAVVIAVVGILANLGSSHSLGRSVDLLGYHLTGSTGKLLLVGVVLGAVAMLGLGLLRAGLRHGASRRRANRQERKAIRQEAGAVADDRDRLANQLAQEHAARLRAEQQPVADPAVGADLPASNPKNV